MSLITSHSKTQGKKQPSSDAAKSAAPFNSIVRFLKGIIMLIISIILLCFFALHCFVIFIGVSDDRLKAARGTPNEEKIQIAYDAKEVIERVGKIKILFSYAIPYLIVALSLMSLYFALIPINYYLYIGVASVLSGVVINFSNKSIKLNLDEKIPRDNYVLRLLKLTLKSYSVMGVMIIALPKII